MAHADVRRMLLRQKAIVEGGLSLLAATALQADLAAHAQGEEERQRAQLLLDLLTPVAHLAHLCRTSEDSYTRMQPEWF